MSADNWAVCPRCKSRAQAARMKAISDVALMYGKVPPGEYNAARAAIPDGMVDRAEFREDYEIYGAEEGTIRVEYSGYCRVCKLTVSIGTEHPIAGLEE